jgi:hypothetical protein
MRAGWRQAPCGRGAGSTRPSTDLRRGGARRGSTVPPVGRISPVSSKRITPLQSRLHPWSGWPMATLAASRAGPSADGQRGSWGQHRPASSGCAEVGRWRGAGSRTGALDAASPESVTPRTGTRGYACPLGTSHRPARRHPLSPWIARVRRSRAGGFVAAHEVGSARRPARQPRHNAATSAAHAPDNGCGRIATPPPSRARAWVRYPGVRRSQPATAVRPPVAVRPLRRGQPSRTRSGRSVG